MEKRNKLFLERISFVLGGRKKHPWGEGLGFKNDRISSIFKKGIPPKADALDVIARAENVNINWLLSGEGHPFYTHDWYTDTQVTELYASEKNQIIFTDGLGRSTLVGEAKEKFEYGDTEANYLKAYVIPNVKLEVLLGHQTQQGDLLLVKVSGATLNGINVGQIGSYRILSGEYYGSTNRYSDTEHENILNFVGRYKHSDYDETSLLNAFKTLDYMKRSAVLTIAEALSNPHNVNVNQLPPGGIINPDSNTKSQTVSVHEEPAPAYKIHSDD